MAIQIRLNKSQIAELKGVVALGPEPLKRLAERIEQATPPPFSPPELRELVREVIPDDPSIADAVMRQVLSFASLRRRRRIDLQDILRGLKTSLLSHDHGIEEGWERIEPAFFALVSSSRVATIAKALDLSYDYENLMQAARIVTDVRPVFDDNVTEIDGAVVSFTLRLRYVSLEGENGISVAMDKNDVELLREECDRALKKAALASDRFGQLPLRTLISGAGDS